jgi:hypothetical protein
VIGPDNAFYIVDDHHNLGALDFAEWGVVTVTVNVTCDKRGETMQSFWYDMRKNNLAYLGLHPLGQENSLPVLITPSDLPVSFDFTAARKSFSDDPWRSIAGFSRKVENAPPPAQPCASYKYCNRCMVLTCSCHSFFVVARPYGCE